MQSRSPAAISGDKLQLVATLRTSRVCATTIVIEIDGRSHGFDQTTTAKTAAPNFWNAKGIGFCVSGTTKSIQDLESVLDTIYADALPNDYRTHRELHEHRPPLPLPAASRGEGSARSAN